MRDTSGFSSRLGRAIGSLHEVRRETQGPFPVATGILGFLLIFKRSHASSPFEALDSMFLSNCQRDLRPPVKMRQETRAFSRIYTGNSDIPSSCDMKHDPAFKLLLGYPVLFLVKASRFPFHLRQQTQGPFHMPVAEKSLLLRCFWKVGIPLQSRSENQLSTLVD